MCKKKELPLAVTEEVSAVGNTVQGDFLTVKLAGKRSTSHYIAEETNKFFWMRIGNWESQSDWEHHLIFITEKENQQFAILSSDTLHKAPYPNVKHHSSVFRLTLVHSASLCIQNVITRNVTDLKFNTA